MTQAALFAPHQGLQRPLAHLMAEHRSDWQPCLAAWQASATGRAVMATVDGAVQAGAQVYPSDVFRALAATPLARTKVVILGQDPYHGPGQADGLAFSVPAGQKVPPSLRNILQEQARDLALAPPGNGNLEAWARQGVLLLNTALTVQASQPGSHAEIGWHALTDGIISAAVADPAPKVFMLWGAHAQTKAPLVQRGGGHLLLQCNHPSPLAARRGARPFIGCGHFGLAQVFLQRHHGTAGHDGGIDWRGGS